MKVLIHAGVIKVYGLNAGCCGVAARTEQFRLTDAAVGREALVSLCGMCLRCCLGAPACGGDSGLCPGLLGEWSLVRRGRSLVGAAGRWLPRVPMSLSHVCF